MSETSSGSPAPVPVAYEDRLAALERNRYARARLDAEEVRLLAALATDCLPGLSAEAGREAVEKHFVREEIAGILSLPGEVAESKIRTALTLVERCPDTLAVLESGGMSFWHARAMAETVTPLSPEVTAAVQKRVLKRAVGQSLGNFRRALRRAVQRLDPANAAHRRRRGMKQRRVAVSHDQDNGMCALFASLSSEGGIVVMNRLNADATLLVAQSKAAAKARARAAADILANDAMPPEVEVLTMDQARADALVNLATGGGPPATAGAGASGSGPRVAGPTVYVAISTLLGEDQQAGELAGAGPITAQHARQLALQHDASWWNLKTDQQGRMLDMSRTRYRPSAALRRFIETRDQHCRFPHCRRPATACDIDHCQAWEHQHGHTCPGNLHPLCTRHHRLKQAVSQ